MTRGHRSFFELSAVTQIFEYVFERDLRVIVQLYGLKPLLKDSVICWVTLDATDLRSFLDNLGHLAYLRMYFSFISVALCALWCDISRFLLFFERLG